MNENKQIELTDEMINSALHAENMQGVIVLILFALAAVCIFLTGIISVIIQKKKKNPGKKLKLTDREFILTGAAVLIMGGTFAAMLYSNRQNAARDEGWQITADTVSELYSAKGSSRHSRIYYAYVTNCRQEIAVSEAEYDLLETGDEVYVVLDSAGEAAGLWRMERYTYVGERFIDGE